jgi:hypothetical protein
MLNGFEMAAWAPLKWPKGPLRARQCCQVVEYRPQTSKGAVKKCEGLEILVAEFFLDLHKKGRKGAELFQDSWLRGNCNLGIFIDEHIFNPILCSYSLTIF